MLPPLDMPNSHEAAQRYTGAMHSKAQQLIVAMYDSWQVEMPSVGTAIERCKFIQRSWAERDDEEFEEDPAPKAEPALPTPAACVAELAARFPFAPVALQFQLEQLWGEEAQAFAARTLARTDVAWTNRERARFITHVAYTMFWQGKNAEAAAYARQARALDAYVDVGLILASDYQARGLRDRAVEELTATPVATYAARKVSLLAELEAFRDASALMEANPEIRGSVPALVQARVLEELGDTTGARAKYGELDGQEWNRRAVLQRLYYLDLASGSRDKAIAAYAALRDQGYRADPVLRRRFALSAAFPLAPWAGRDLLGLMCLLLLLLFTAALPAVVILPVHYAGLLRVNRALPTTPARERWSLKHLWIIAGSVLVAEMVGTYLFAYDELQALLFDEAGASSTRLQIARAGTFGLVGSAAAVLAWLRADDLPRWLRGEWSFRRNFNQAILCLLLVLFVGRLGTRVLQWVGWLSDDAPLSVGLTTMEVMSSIRDVYGAALLFPLAAVLVPIYEEVAFRGVLLGSVGRHLPFAWANALQATLFTLAHDDVAHYPSFFALAIGAGFLFKRSRGLVAPIIMHAALNSLAVFAICMAPSISAAKRSSVESVALPSPGQFSAEALRKRCDGGEGASCHLLADRYNRGDGVTKDFAASASLYEKACDMGIAAGCGALGHQYWVGEGKEIDVARGLELSIAGCNGGSAYTCANLAAAYQNGRHFRPDPAAAGVFADKACEGGDPRACGWLGQLYQTGEGLGHDPVRARKLFERACYGGDAAGCADLGRAFRAGEGVQQNLTRGTQLLERACVAREASACAELKK
jgi:membrane protease YdiL (CAAX protease family)